MLDLIPRRRFRILCALTTAVLAGASLGLHAAGWSVVLILATVALVIAASVEFWP